MMTCARLTVDATTEDAFRFPTDFTALAADVERADSLTMCPEISDSLTRAADDTSMAWATAFLALDAEDDADLSPFPARLDSLDRDADAARTNLPVNLEILARDDEAAESMNTIRLDSLEAADEEAVRCFPALFSRLVMADEDALRALPIPLAILEAADEAAERKNPTCLWVLARDEDAAISDATIPFMELDNDEDDADRPLPTLLTAATTDAEDDDSTRKKLRRSNLDLSARSTTTYRSHQDRCGLSDGGVVTVLPGSHSIASMDCPGPTTIGGIGISM